MPILWMFPALDSSWTRFRFFVLNIVIYIYNPFYLPTTNRFKNNLLILLLFNTCKNIVNIVYQPKFQFLQVLKYLSKSFLYKFDYYY